MEECVFRAVPLALGALIGERYGRRRLGIAIAFVLQAVVFGGAHANYPGFPSYSRLVELTVPSMLWALIFLRYGLLPTIMFHALFDLALISIPLFLVDAEGAWVQRALVIAAALVPAGVVLMRRLQNGAWGTLPAALRNGAWRPLVPATAAPERVDGRGNRERARRAAATRASIAGTGRACRLDRVHRVARRCAAARHRPRRRRSRRRVGARRAPRRPRSAVASLLGAEGRDRGSGATAVSRVRLARSRRRGVSRARRTHAGASAVGRALRPLRWRCRGSRGRVARHRCRRWPRAPGAAPAAGGKARRAARARRGAGHCGTGAARSPGAGRRSAAVAFGGPDAAARAARLGLYLRGPAHRCRQRRRGTRAGRGRRRRSRARRAFGVRAGSVAARGGRTRGTAAARQDQQHRRDRAGGDRRVDLCRHRLEQRKERPSRLPLGHRNFTVDACRQRQQLARGRDAAQDRRAGHESARHLHSRRARRWPAVRVALRPARRRRRVLRERRRRRRASPAVFRRGCWAWRPRSRRPGLPRRSRRSSRR